MARQGKMLYAIFLLAVLPFVAPKCTFPDNLVGTWVTSTLSTLTFTNTTVGPIVTQGRTDIMECYENNGTKYAIRSDPYAFGPTYFVDYTCLSLMSVSDTKYYYYQLTKENPDHNNERVAVFFNSTSPTLDQVCDEEQPTATGTYSFMLEEGSLGESVIQCPDSILSVFNVTMDGCPGGANLDACSNKTQLDFNYTQCGAGGYSGEMVYNCLYSTADGGSTFLTLYNEADDPSGNNPFIPFSCMVLETSGVDIKLTHAPIDCMENQSPTSADSPAVSLDMVATNVCHMTEAPPTTGTTHTGSNTTSASSNTTVAPDDGSTTPGGNSTATVPLLTTWALLVPISVLGWINE